MNHELIKHKNEIPIFLKLDSLHEHQTIDNWIEESIKKVYNVDEKTINTISGKYNEIGIVFLLDGFDEIEPSQQKQRATDLNEFIEKHECKTVITSQMEKKDLLLPELSNNTFAELQPLDQEQMNNYVIKELKLEDTVKTIRPQTWESLTHNNAAIEDLLKKPLFLIIATDNFNKRPDKGKTIQQLIDAPTGEVIEIENMDLEEFHDNLFEDYSKNKFRELERKNKTFSKKKIVWLAQRLNNTESTLSIENMQPTLLSGNKEKICYYILVGLIVGILCGLSTGILSEILNYDSDNSQPYLNTIYYIFFGLISGAISGLMGGMIIFWLKLKIDTQSKVTSTIISRIISWLKLSPDTQYTVISFIIGVISGIIRRLSSTFLGSDKIQIVDIIVFGIVFALIFYFLNLSEEKIESVSHQEWYFDSTRAKKSVQDGMVWAVFSGVVMWIFLIASLINRIFGFLVTEQLNNPWLNNFTKIVTDIDIQKDNIPVSLIGLLLFISVNYWLFLEITKANNQNTQEDKNRKIPREYMYFGLFIFVIIIRILISFIPFILKNIEQFYKFYGTMNTFYWGILSLELFVGLNIGLLLGFKKTDNTSNTSNQSQNNFIKKIRENVIQKLKSAKLIKDRNNSILKTFVNLVVISLIIGFLSSIISWIFWEGFSRYPKFVWWIFYRQNQNYGGILFGICVGLMISLLSGLVNGEKSGLVCIKYFALRLVLWWYKHIPWNYGQFLEEAVKVDLLKKEGESYKFRHKELREYIAKNI